MLLRHQVEKELSQSKEKLQAEEAQRQQISEEFEQVPVISDALCLRYLQRVANELQHCMVSIFRPRRL